MDLGTVGLVFMFVVCVCYLCFEFGSLVFVCVLCVYCCLLAYLPYLFVLVTMFACVAWMFLLVLWWLWYCFLVTSLLFSGLFMVCLSRVLYVGCGCCLFVGLDLLCLWLSILLVSDCLFWLMCFKLPGVVLCLFDCFGCFGFGLWLVLLVLVLLWCFCLYFACLVVLLYCWLLFGFWFGFCLRCVVFKLRVFAGFILMFVLLILFAWFWIYFVGSCVFIWLILLVWCVCCVCLAFAGVVTYVCDASGGLLWCAWFVYLLCLVYWFCLFVFDWCVCLLLFVCFVFACCVS